MNSKATIITATLLASSLLACAPASADIVIGAPGSGQNFVPFGSNAWIPEYQQVYAASDFQGTIKIDDLAFYVYPGSTGTPNAGTYQISLSTTSAVVGALSANLSSNIGTNNTIVYNAALPAVQNGVLDILFSAPFIYNPADGNLLIDIYSTTAVIGGGLGFEYNAASGGLFSRAYSAINPNNNNQGLVTGFSTIPEPSTWAMMVLGFVGVGFAGYRASGRVRAAAV